MRSRPPDPPTPLNMPQMPPNAHHAAAQSQQHAKDDDQGDVLWGKEDETRKSASAAVTEEHIAGVAEAQREQPAHKAFERPFEQKGPSNEPVRGPDQPHDRDLTGALEE